jgi:hypothetical protein
MSRAASKTTKSPKESYQPVLQRFQVQVRGARYYVVDTQRGVTAGGPYVHRSRAQAEADRLERNAPAGRRT